LRKLCGVPELEGSLEDLEALRLVRMDVRRRDAPAGPDGDLDVDELAAGLRRGGAEQDVLAGDGVLDRVAGAERGGRRGHGIASWLAGVVTC
jgi:hypothetical protein